jgi:hypothetical protein
MEFNNDDVGVLPWGHERRGAHCTASIRKADLDFPVYLQGGPRFLMIFLLFALAHSGQCASITDILLRTCSRRRTILNVFLPECA